MGQSLSTARRHSVCIWFRVKWNSIVRGFERALLWCCARVTIEDPLMDGNKRASDLADEELARGVVEMVNGDLRHRQDITQSGNTDIIRGRVLFELHSDRSLSSTEDNVAIVIDDNQIAEQKEEEKPEPPPPLCRYPLSRSAPPPPTPVMSLQPTPPTSPTRKTSIPPPVPPAVSPNRESSSERRAPTPPTIPRRQHPPTPPPSPAPANVVVLQDDDWVDVEAR